MGSPMPRIMQTTIESSRHRNILLPPMLTIRSESLTANSVREIRVIKICAPPKRPAISMIVLEELSEILCPIWSSSPPMLFSLSPPAPAFLSFIRIFVMIYIRAPAMDA